MFDYLWKVVLCLCFSCVFCMSYLSLVLIVFSFFSYFFVLLLILFFVKEEFFFLIVEILMIGFGFMEIFVFVGWVLVWVLCLGFGDLDVELGFSSFFVDVMVVFFWYMWLGVLFVVDGGVGIMGFGVFLGVFEVLYIVCWVF